MAAERITTQEATEKSIGLYGEVITRQHNREIRPEVKIIADSDMFGECIFCQMQSYIVRNVDSLREIQEILKRDFLIKDDKMPKYKLTELIPDKGTKETLLFMEIAYIAFQISLKSKDFSLLRAFIELNVMNIVNNDSYVNEKLEEVTGNLRKGWEKRIESLYKIYFNTEKERSYLGIVCGSLKLDMSNLEMIKKDSRFHS